MCLDNKIVLITGASSGIGEACAESFAEAGVKLILVARRKEKLEKISENIKNKFGASSIFFQCDVRSEKNVKEVIEKLPKEWESIDILINNAGLARGVEKIQDGKITNWDEMIDTNIKGLLYVTHYVLPKMREKKSGMIINIGSVAGREVYPGGNIYCATKSAVAALARAWQLDLNGTGIRISNIEPGMVETEFSDVRFSGDKEKAKLVYKGWTPLDAKDVAEAALFCATRPPHVSIHDMLIMGTDQASTFLINKKL
jgi:3-hydroxy acid dehydrogenase / malonic semialdehyde reductase